MRKDKKNTLDQDIQDRFKAEKKQLIDPPTTKNPGQNLQKIIAILIAIISLAGVLYPLISMFR